MSLQFIMGNSGSGKSAWLYEHVLEQAVKYPDKNFLFLVPEQFTMQTQKEFVNRHPAHAILNIDVLSFQRLAYRVFDDLGMTDVVVLEENGKNLVLRNVAMEKEDSLQLLRANIRKTGYISEMKSLLSELTQYHISVEDLEQVMNTLDHKNVLWYKLNDILTLYRGFLDELKGKYVTADEVVNLLTRVAPESEMLKGSVVVLDGYTGFTPVQHAFLEELLVLAQSVQIAVTIDERDPIYGEPDIQDLFYLSKKTIQGLCETARRLKVEILDPVTAGQGRKKRFKNAPAIFHLEQNLFRNRPARYRKEQQEIQICSLFQPKDELRFVASEIRRLVSKERYRYMDLAVVTADVPSYANYAEEIFELYQIPLFIDQKKNILFHPMTELVRAVLEMEISDYSYESVMRYFKSGLSGMDTYTMDLMENYLLAFGIRGFGRFQKSWVRAAAWLEEAELEELNEAREAFFYCFLPFHEIMKKKGATVREMTVALYELLVRLKVQEQAEEQRQQFEAQGMLAQAKENEQIYEIVIQLFDKVVSLLADKVVTGKEFAEILDAGFEASRVGIIPPGYDRVLFGDIERTRLEHIKVLFFIGVNDGMVPKQEAVNGILSESEREKLLSRDLVLAPTAREKAFIQKFYLYLNLTKPSDRLCLTFSQAGQEGTTRRKSYLIGVIQKMFPKIAIRTPKEETATAKSSMQYFLRGLAQAKNGEAEEEWKALYAWYMKQEPWKQTISDYVNAAFLTHQDTQLGREIARQLYGTVLANSVTRLERFAGCAFAHFLQYGLKLKKRQLNEFESVDFGSILHDALEQFAHRMQAAGDDWFQLTKERQKQYAKEAIDQAIAACKNTALADGERNMYLVRRMEKVLNRTVDVLGRQIRSGSFQPENYEVAFEYVSRLDAINFQLGEEEKMRLRGRIDRMDVWEREKEIYVRVIDYKSGNTSFQLLSLYHGLQLQLVVYLNAAVGLMREKHPDKTVKPAGIFYYHIDDPLLDTDQELTEEEIREQIFAKLRLDGYVDADPNVYRAMDQQMQSSSNILPIAENKDGTLRKNSKAISQEQFATISDYVNRKIAELGVRMMHGQIDINPYELNGRTPCEYCEYRSVCGFDEKIDGFSYRRLEGSDQAADILEQMKKESDQESFTDNRFETKAGNYGNDMDEGAAAGNYAKKP